MTCLLPLSAMSQIAGSLIIGRQWFNPRPLQSTCLSVLRQDTQWQIGPDAAVAVCA